MKLLTVEVVKPEPINFVFGQSHFIKTVEDLHEAIVATAPHMKFGVAFCEASGPCLVRRSGNDPAMLDLAVRNAVAVGAGHTFFVFMDNGFPVNILNTLKAVPEVCRIFCATANPVQVLRARSDQGAGIAGVIDGSSPLGVEGEADKSARKSMLRKFGYKY